MRDVPLISRSRRRLAGALVFLLIILAAAAAAVPLWVIRPWVSQTPEGLALAYHARRWAPLGTVLALAIGLGLTFWLWRGARWWSRTALALALAGLPPHGHQQPELPDGRRADGVLVAAGDGLGAVRTPEG
jgi:hypothetical protein